MAKEKKCPAGGPGKGKGMGFGRRLAEAKLKEMEGKKGQAKKKV